MEKFKLSDYFNEIVRDNCFESLGILDSKTKKSILTFVDDKKYVSKLLEKSNITCLITNQMIFSHLPKDLSLGVFVCDNPRVVFFKLHNKLSKNSTYCRKIFETKIGHNCKISPLSYISKNNVIIGNNVIIEEFVSIKENVEIGDNCIIRAGTIIGGSGFEFKKENKSQFRVEHLGGVKIGNDVEIQYNCAIDKAVYPWDDTLIGDFTKIDNLVHVGHAAKIGKNVMMPALSVIGGRVEINDDAWIGIGSVIRNGITIGSKARTNMGAVVTKDVEENQSVSGNFAIEHSKFIKKMKKECEDL